MKKIMLAAAFGCVGDIPNTKRLLCAAALVALAAPAYAANLDYAAYTYSGIGVDITTPNSIGGGAGPIYLWKNGNDTGLLATAWCMDVNNYLVGSDNDGILPFTVAEDKTGVHGVPTTLSLTQLHIIGNLVLAGDKATDPTQQGAYQVAIWTTEYGAYNAVTNPGGFGYSSPNDTGFYGDVATDIAIATAAGAPNLNDFHFLEPSVTSQTLVYGTAVPEPSTWLMGAMGFALLGFAAMRRKEARYTI